MTVILALDPATKTGVCIGAPGDEKPFICTMNFRGDKLSDRIDIGVNARLWIDRVLDGNLLIARESRRVILIPPTVLAIESPIGFRGNVSTAYLAFGLHLTFCAAARQRRVHILETPINTWRKFCFGIGNLSRADAKFHAFEVCKNLGWEAQDDNAAEAACIWLFACSQICPTKAFKIDPLFFRRSA